MGGDREAALLVDLADRRAEAPHRLHALLEEQRDEMAAEGRDLLADDHLRPVAEVAGHRPGGDRGVDPLVVGDRDDVEVGRALDEVEDRGDPVDAVRREAVDVEIGSAEALGHAAGFSDGDPGSAGDPGAAGAASAATPRLGREIRPDLEERARPLLRRVADERLERGRERRQGGRDPLPARALRRDGNEGQAAGDAAVGQPPDPDGRDPRPGLDRQQRRPDRERRRRAEERHLDPAARRCPGRRRSRRSRRPSGRRRARAAPTGARRSGPRASRASPRTRPGAAGRRRSPSGRRTSEPDRWARYRAGSSIGPKWADTKITGPPEKASSISAGVSTTTRSSRNAGLRPGHPEDLEVVAGVVAEPEPDEPLELARVAGGRAGPVGTASLRGQMGRDPGEVPSALRGARRRDPVPDASRDVGERHADAFGQVAGDPRMPHGSAATRARWPAVPRPAGGAPAAGPGRPGHDAASSCSGGSSDSGRAPTSASGTRRRVRWAGLAEHPGRARLELGRLLGRRRPHRLEAVPLLRGGRERRLERIRDLLRRPGDVRVGRRRHRDHRREPGVEHPVRAAPDRDRQDHGAGLGGEGRGPRRQRGPVAEEPDRDAVGSIAPVDQERRASPCAGARRRSRGGSATGSRGRPTPRAAGGTARTSRGSSNRRRRR